MLTTILLRLKNLGSSHSWRFPPCCIPVFSGGSHLPTLSFLFGFLQLVYLYCSTRYIRPPICQCCTSAPPSSSNLLPSFCSLYIFSFFAPSPPPHVSGSFLILPASSSFPDLLRVLQWNAGGLRARSTELLHFISSHPVDLICIQKSILHSSSSFRILCSAI